MGFGDQLRKALGDQIRGTLKHGGSTSYSHNRAAMLAAKEEREARERAYARPTRKGGWYSRSKAGKIELFIGPNGDITAERPHVHVIHDDSASEVIFVVTMSDGTHPIRKTLPGSASGNEVNEVIADLLRHLK